MHNLNQPILSSGAMVGLERTVYNVLENEGVVEVCAIVESPDIDCPIQFPFNVSLSTRNGTAGKHVMNSL